MLDSRHSRRLAVAAIAFVLAVAAGMGSLGVPPASRATEPAVGGTSLETTTPLRIDTLTSPTRSVVSDQDGWLATFTNGSMTVTMAGPERIFAEASTPDRVISRTWVRLLPTPFFGTVDLTWLASARADSAPDLLAIAFQYTTDAPSVLDSRGLRVAGDASYGPLQADGTRQEGSDFNDYLGVTWRYADGTVDPPEAAQLGALDCSGFVRMVLGYRSGIPLSLSAATGSIPRRAFQQAASAPAVILIANKGVAPKSRSSLAPGDLVFFDASTNDGTQIDHVGIYLGRDTAGHDRFISSRKSADGPTMGDFSGRSVLDGTGLYAKSFRTARRV